MKFSRKDYSTSNRIHGFATLLLVFTINVVLAQDELEQDLNKVLFRPRLGHFADTNGFLDLFVAYFNNVIIANDKAAESLPGDHWRRYRPSGDLCLNFLHGFKEAKGYALNKPYEIILLDACLDWLYENSSEKQLDLNQLNVVAQGESAKLAKDKRLRSIYESTHFKDDSVPHELKKQLFDYLTKLLKINADNPRNGCHGLWLEGYTDFIEDVYLDECDDDDECVYFGWPEASEDSYLKLIVDSTKSASKNCYKVMQKQVKGLMNRAYTEEPKITRHFLSSKAAKQSDSMKWGREMMRILQLVTGTDSESSVDLGNVVRDLNKLKQRDEDTVEHFTEALARYAIQNVNLKDSANDPTGRARYGKAMVKLCRPYINEQIFLASTGGSNLWEDPNVEKKPFEFYSIVYGLVRLTNHPSFYGVTKDKFEEDIIKNGWESLYLATFACQLISSTYGELNYDTNEAAFDVSFRESEEQILIDDWPIEVMMSKQTREGSSLDDSPHGKKSGSTGSEGRGLLGFGLKFGLGSKQKKPSPSNEEQTEVEKPKKPTGSFGFGIRLGKDHSKQPASSQASNSENDNVDPTNGNRSGGFGISLKKPKEIKKPQDNHQAISAPKPVGPEPPVAQETAPMPVIERAPEQAPTPAVPTVASPSSSRAKVPSLKTIEMFRNLHGRYPSDLPANIHEIYPELPKNLDGEYPKKVASKHNKPTEPARPRLSDMRFNKEKPSSYADRKSKFATDEAPAKPANKWANVNTFFK